MHELRPLPVCGKRKEMKNILRTYVAPVAAAVILLLFMHSMMAMQIAVKADYPEMDLMAGDRAVVWRPAYGLRMPLESLLGYRRWGYVLPKRGDRVAYTDAKGRIGIATIVNLPSDTVRGKHIVPQGYYWTGKAFLPHSALVGRITAVSYSIDSSRPFPHAFRKERFFYRLH